MNAVDVAGTRATPPSLDKLGEHQLRDNSGDLWIPTKRGHCKWRGCPWKSNLHNGKRVKNTATQHFPSTGTSYRDCGDVFTRGDSKNSHIITKVEMRHLEAWSAFHEHWSSLLSHCPKLHRNARGWNGKYIFPKHWIGYLTPFYSPIPDTFCRHTRILCAFMCDPYYAHYLLDSTQEATFCSKVVASGNCLVTSMYLPYFLRCSSCQV